MRVTHENVVAVNASRDFRVHDGKLTHVMIFPRERRIEIYMELQYERKMVMIIVEEYATFSTMDFAMDGCLVLGAQLCPADDFGVEAQNFDTVYDDISAIIKEKDASQYIAMKIVYKSGDVMKAVCRAIAYDAVEF